MQNSVFGFGGGGGCSVPFFQATHACQNGNAIILYSLVGRLMVWDGGLLCDAFVAGQVRLSIFLPSRSVYTPTTTNCGERRREEALKGSGRQQRHNLEFGSDNNAFVS